MSISSSDAGRVWNRHPGGWAFLLECPHIVLQDTGSSEQGRGGYMLDPYVVRELRWLERVCLALACLGASGCGPSQEARVGASTAEILVFTPTVADVRVLKEAFAKWESIPISTCPADALEIAANSLMAATVNGTGESWAIARFIPSETCKIFNLPGANQTAMLSVDPRLLRGLDGAPVAVFERARGANWIMNQEGGAPFPCPAPNGTPPSKGNGSLPPSVLSAWGLAYAKDCSTVSYPRQPT